MPRPKHAALRKELIETYRVLAAAEIWRTELGDVSVRTRDGFLIGPSGVAPESMTQTAMVDMDYDGAHNDDRAPSRHWALHLDLYRARPEAGAVIRSEPIYAAALSCLRQDLPAFHYRMARVGGPTLRCAAFAAPETEALSAAALTALEGRKACLLANHGLLCVGQTLAEARQLTIDIEALCRTFIAARRLGDPVILDDQDLTL